MVLEGLTRLDSSSLPGASRVLTRAFQYDPVWSYFIPDAEKRRRLMPGIFALRLRTAFVDGEVYAPTSALEGVAVWVPSDKPELTLRRLLSRETLRLFFRLRADVLLRMMRAGTCMARVRERQAPPRYCYLSPIGIDPRFQGKGYASRLIKPMLARLEAERMSCFLETQSERNVAIYEHFGFRVLEKIVIPGGGFSHWVMLK